MPQASEAVRDSRSSSVGVLPEASARVRVIVVDEHAVIRTALGTILEKAGGIAVVGAFECESDAVAAARSLRPTVAVFGLSSSPSRRCAAIEAMSRESPETAVIVFSDKRHPSFAIEAIRAGARGYLAKSASPEEIVAAVRATHAGGGVVSPELAGKVFERLRARRPSDRPFQELSTREVEILELISDGQGRRIGSCLGISDETVKTHLKRVFHKLGASDRAHAVALAMRHGFLG